jgi:hypothetical protein
MVPTCRLSQATLRQLLLGHHLTPGDRVLDATADGEFIEIFEFLGLNVDDPDEIFGSHQPGRPRFVLARPENRSTFEFSRTVAGWLSLLSPGGTLVVIDAPNPDLISTFPGVSRTWISDGSTFTSLTISSQIRTAAEWQEFSLPGALPPIVPAA